MLLCTGLIGALYDDGRFGEGALHVAFHYGEVLEHIVRPVLDLRRLGTNPEIEDGRLRRHLDRDGATARRNAMRS